MTKEEKELLLKELGARLQYKLHCCVFKLNGDIKENDDVLYGVIGDNVMTLKSDKDECLMYYQIKPYLRPMSSMTEEESKEFALFQTDFYIDGFLYPIAAINMVNWLNSHHFDYCGLIERGLALPATKEMYKD